jgi:ElaA protein
MTTNWTLQRFDELTPTDLYAILRLRSEVFVVEQNCVFLDMDNKDQQCLHLSGWLDTELLAYTRIVPPGVAYIMPSIGRVVSSPRARGTGIGRELMQRSIEAVYNLYGQQPIKIGAQYYLKSFYTSLGFLQSGAIYLEDGIEHIEMIKQ